MRAKFDIKFLLSQITEQAAKERKVVGGTYKAFFYFEGIPDYFSIYGNGLVQAIGQDEAHTYYKPWMNSSFASFSPETILEQLGYQISKIVIEGCGNNYTKIFLSFRSFLEWIGMDVDSLGIDLPPEKNKEVVLIPLGDSGSKEKKEDNLKEIVKSDEKDK